MEDIAWVLRTDPARKQIGFVQAQKLEDLPKPTAEAGKHVFSAERILLGESPDGGQRPVDRTAPLFRVETGIRYFDVSPDGRRFLVSTPLEKSPESPIRVILNWTSALKKEK